MSINVEFKSIGPGKCRWCKKDRDEVIELAFGDGSFVGRYCFADFKKALQDKLENDEPGRPAAAPAAVPKPEPKIAAALAAQAVPAGNGPPK